jgi:hypothetical protein
VVDIPAAAFDDLAPFVLARRGRGAKKLFASPKHINWNRVFRQDCKAAGIDRLDGHKLGLHSLRRWYITAGVRNGGLAVAQRLARHSTPALTMKYADLDASDRAAALDKLPRLWGPDPASAWTPARLQEWIRSLPTAEPVLVLAVYDT